MSIFTSSEVLTLDFEFIPDPRVDRLQQARLCHRFPTSDTALRTRMEILYARQAVAASNTNISYTLVLLVNRWPSEKSKRGNNAVCNPVMPSIINQTLICRGWKNYPIVSQSSFFQPVSLVHSIRPYDISSDAWTAA